MKQCMLYAVACDIILSEPDQFRDIFLAMGPFHWVRVLLRCQGKLLRDSGVDDSLVECEIFGPGVLASVLNGGHYVRSFTGMLVIEDTIRLMQWEMSGREGIGENILSWII